MRDSIYRITLDMHDVASQVQITAKKGDIARKIYITLTENGQPYTIQKGCSAIMMIKKPDGTILMNDCDIRLKDSVIMYEFTAQTVAVIGLSECEVRLYGLEEEMITSPRFTMKVSATVYDDGQIESRDEFGSLLDAIAACNNLDIDVNKVGTVTTVTITKKDGTQKSEHVIDCDVDMMVDLINKKTDKVKGAVSGHLASLNSNGNLQDSGKSVNDFLTTASLKDIVTKPVEFEENDIAIFDEKGNLVDSEVNIEEISKKANKSEVFTEGNVVVFDEEGNLADSEKKLDDYMEKKEGMTSGNIPIFDEEGNLADSKKKISDIPKVVQTSGTSTTSVMSQDAVTTEMDKKIPKNNTALKNNIAVFGENGTLEDSGFNFEMNYFSHWTASDVDMNEGDALTSGHYYAVYE